MARKAETISDKLHMQLERLRNREGQLHCEDGPAVFNADHSHEEYWIEGKRHRVSGPAVKLTSGISEYYINGALLTQREWEMVVRGIASSGIDPMSKEVFSFVRGKSRRLCLQSTPAELLKHYGHGPA
jgi:hypothetical protein